MASYVAASSGVDISIAHLRIDASPTINASASPDGTVQINLALSELISDSPSELAFAIGHELGHILQFKIGRLAFSSNKEIDADQWGMLFAMVSGYAGAGVLAKLTMANGPASWLSSSTTSVATCMDHSIP
jgi:predicted Zn-dependent protease